MSSTLKELAAERAAARTAIEQLRLAPWAAPPQLSIDDALTAALP